MVLLQFETGYARVLEALTQHEFFLTLYLPVIIWLVLIVILMGLLMRRYTFGNWTAEKPNPYQDETLGLPRGLFRGVLTITLVFVTVLLEVTNIRLGNDEGNIREFLVAFQMMIAFYFGSKVMHHVTSTENKKAKYRAQAHVQVNTGQEFGSSSSDATSNIEEQMANMYAAEAEEFEDEEAAG